MCGAYMICHAVIKEKVLDINDQK